MALRNRRLAQLALFFALATLHTWPLATDPAHLSRLDNDDTAFNTWVIAWVAHQLPRDPMHLFDAPIFYPEHDTLAYSEHMIVQSVLGAPLQWSGVSPVLVFNLLIWVGMALSGFAMCVVLERWTGSAAAGIVAGCLYAFNAHLLTRFAHLQAMHMEFLPGALYAFDRLLQRPAARVAAAFGGLFVLQALCSNYTMVLAATALLAALIVRPEPWRRDSARLWLTLGVTAVVAALVLVPFLLPYERIRTEQHLSRSIDEVQFYSATWRDYLTTAGRLHLKLWAASFFGDRTSLFPGIGGLLLAAGAIASGLAWRDTRARMAIAFGVLGFALSFGPALPGYSWLHEHIPLLQGIRAAARWGYLLLIAVAILSGFAVAELRRRCGDRWWWPALAFGLVGLVTIEAMRAPLALVRFDGIPAVEARLAREDVRAIVVLPLYSRGQLQRNARYLLDQTRHWRPMINGYSSFVPNSFHERAARLQAFPDVASVRELRSIGISHVVVERNALVQNLGRPEAEALLARLRVHPDLELVFEEDDADPVQAEAAGLTSETCDTSRAKRRGYGTLARRPASADAAQPRGSCRRSSRSRSARATPRRRD